MEVLKQGETVSSCFEDTSSKGDSYGSISNHDCNVNTPDVFHRLIKDIVVPKVVPLQGNKVTKVSMNLIDGYDCYYTTSEEAGEEELLVCFTDVTIPKILPIRLLSELKKDGGNGTDTALSGHVGQILDEFHNELTALQNENSEGASTENDLQDVVNIMNNNIDKFLERQERISLLVDKTSQLNDNSHNFKKKAVRIKERMWWQRMKNTTLMIFAVILTVSALFIFFYVL